MAIATGFGPRGYRVGVAEIERQGRWSVSETPPIGPTRSSLSDVSCTSATSCVAVGSSNVVTSPVILRWNGTDWHVLTGPATKGDGPVTAVSCASAGYCVALGAKHDWTIRRDQLTPIAPSDVDTAISCVSATFCLAVGSAGTAGRQSGLVERWDGGAWSDVPAADVRPGDHRSVALTGVSCSGGSDCSVVGNITYYSASGQRHRFVTETNDAGAWHRAVFPKAAGVNVPRTSFGVSCTSPKHCVAAVRARVGGQLATETLVRGRGGWTLVPMRYPHDREVVARLTAISCSSGGCTLVGGKHSAGASGRIVHERHATARNQIPARVREADESTLFTVSCTGSFCLAVGYAQNPDSTLSPLAAATAGGRWHHLSVPQRHGELLDVSCVTAQFCMAVGFGVRRAVGTAAIWNGTSWRAVPVTGGPVRGVSCPTTRFCAGSPIHRGNQLLWQIWRPRTGWQTETLSPPAGLRRSGPISCASATDCWTTRNYYGVDERHHVLASHWNGSAWTTQQLHTRYVGDISCPSVDFCIAVGLTESKVWNGTSWSVVPYENGAHLETPRLSCVNAHDCTVLGGNGSTGDPVDAITQHWNGHEWGQQQTYPPDGAAEALGANSLGCNMTGCATVGASAPRFNIPAILQNY